MDDDSVVGRPGGSVWPSEMVLIEGVYGTARMLTEQVRRVLEQSGVPVTTVPATQIAHRELALPTVVASFEDERQVTFEGHSRIELDLFPLLPSSART